MASSYPEEKREEWWLNHCAICAVHKDLMDPVSRGVFQESPKRIVYEVMFHCAAFGCSKVALREWRIAEKNIALWDMLFFGHAIDPEPFEGESFEAFCERMEALYIAFGIAQTHCELLLDSGGE